MNWKKKVSPKLAEGNNKDQSRNKETRKKNGGKISKLGAIKKKKVTKPLSRQTKKNKRLKYIKNEREGIATDTIETQKILRNYCE